MTAAPVAMRDAFGEALLSLATECPELVVLDADVSTSTRTAAFGERHPHRFFNVGVAEANMVDIAAGCSGDRRGKERSTDDDGEHRDQHPAHDTW